MVRIYPNQRRKIDKVKSVKLMAVNGGDSETYLKAKFEKYEGIIARFEELYRRAKTKSTVDKGLGEQQEETEEAVRPGVRNEKFPEIKDERGGHEEMDFSLENIKRKYLRDITLSVAQNKSRVGCLTESFARCSLQVC